MGYPDLQTGSANKTLYVSEDGGRSWSRRAATHVDAQQASSGYQMVLASNRQYSAVMASHQSTLAVTNHGGKTWTQVGPAGVGFQMVSFDFNNDAWALDTFRTCGSHPMAETGGPSFPHITRRDLPRSGSA